MYHATAVVAEQAAKAALGERARKGRHFYVKQEGCTHRWVWGVIPPGRSYPWRGKFKSRAEVDKYLSGDLLICLLCGTPYDHLATHVRVAHGLSARAYKDRFDIPRGRGIVGARTRQKMPSGFMRWAEDPANRAAFDERMKRIGRMSRRGKCHFPQWYERERQIKWRAGLGRWLLRQSIERGQISGEQILDRARKSLSPILPSDMREEIAQEIAVAVCSGTLSARNIEKESHSFVVAFNRENRGKYGDLSLEAPIYGEGHAR